MNKIIFLIFILGCTSVPSPITGVIPPTPTPSVSPSPTDIPTPLPSITPTPTAFPGHPVDPNSTPYPTMADGSVDPNDPTGQWMLWCSDLCDEFDSSTRLSPEMKAPNCGCNKTDENGVIYP